MTTPSHIRKALEGVRSRDVQFATMPDQPGHPASLARRVMVTAPPALAELARFGDPRVLDALVELLADPDRAWAAEVALAAMTRHEEMIVAAYGKTPDEWLETRGAKAPQQWREWLDEHRNRLSWDAEKRVFVEHGES